MLAIPTDRKPISDQVIADEILHERLARNRSNERRPVMRQVVEPGPMERAAFESARLATAFLAADRERVAAQQAVLAASKADKAAARRHAKVAILAFQQAQQAVADHAERENADMGAAVRRGRDLEVVHIRDGLAKAKSSDRAAPTVRISRVRDPLRDMWKPQNKITNRDYYAATKLRSDWEASEGSGSPSDTGSRGTSHQYGPTERQIIALRRFFVCRDVILSADAIGHVIMYLVLRGVSVDDVAARFHVEVRQLEDAAAVCLSALADHYALGEKVRPDEIFS